MLRIQWGVDLCSQQDGSVNAALALELYLRAYNQIDAFLNSSQPGCISYHRIRAPYADSTGVVVDPNVGKMEGSSCTPHLHRRCLFDFDSGLFDQVRGGHTFDCFRLDLHLRRSVCGAARNDTIRLRNGTSD